MITLIDTIEIAADPTALFEWFRHLPAHYLAWHPDHVLCRFEGPEELRPGARLYTEEYLHGRLHKLRVTITRVSAPMRVEYRIAPGLRGSFTAVPSPGGTQFTADLELGFTWPIVGSLTDRVLRRFFRGMLAAVQQHMVEEGVNLKRILETPDRAG